jgi:hypothetical protein
MIAICLLIWLISARTPFREGAMACKPDVQSSILLTLEEMGPCTTDQLRRRLSAYTWSQVFEMVSKLNREGQLSLQHTANFECIASLNETNGASSDHRVHRKGGATGNGEALEDRR